MILQTSGDVFCAQTLHVQSQFVGEFIHPSISPLPGKTKRNTGMAGPVDLLHALL